MEGAAEAGPCCEEAEVVRRMCSAMPGSREK